VQNFSYVMGSDPTPRTTHPSWYRGEHCNFIPSQRNLAEQNAAEEYVLKGWLPRNPFLSRANVVTAFGSCFADHVSTYLREQGYTTGLSLVSKGIHGDFANSHVVRFGAGIVNTFALRQQFEWAYEGRCFDEALWHGDSGEIASYDESLRDATRALFERTDVFILTLGLAEVWHSKDTGEVFWRAIPKEQFDPRRHGFRVSTCAENTANLERIWEIIRRHRPQAHVIVTLSPVPLVATFRPVSCITANVVSKSILRVAIDELTRAHPEDERLHYWPAYEIVKELCPDPYEEDNRHVKPDVVAGIMELFRKHYLLESWSEEERTARRRAALALLATLPGVDEALAEGLHRAGWQTPREIAETPPALLVRLRGVPDECAARSLHRAACEFVACGRSAQPGVLG